MGRSRNALSYLTIAGSWTIAMDVSGISSKRAVGEVLGGFWPASRRYEGRMLEGLNLLLMAVVKLMLVT